jgi:hypothetical protein|tara:strand:+ start:19114 stop:19260 length:147 start_codon:yes stop_codon:yes gene_type:complete
MQSSSLPFHVDLCNSIKGFGETIDKARQIYGGPVEVGVLGDWVWCAKG